MDLRAILPEDNNDSLWGLGMPCLWSVSSIIQSSFQMLSFLDELDIVCAPMVANQHNRILFHRVAIIKTSCHGKDSVKETFSCIARRCMDYYNVFGKQSANTYDSEWFFSP